MPPPDTADTARMADRIAQELGLPVASVLATVALLEEGATVPFIARYRKEATGSLDEVAIADVRDSLARLLELDKRRETVLESLRDRDLLTPELDRRILGATSMTQLEDLYLPFRPKRRTKATIAREAGLEPLAVEIRSGRSFSATEEQLAGARDIVAEWIAEDPETRSELRRLFEEESRLIAKVVAKKKDQAAKFRDYFDWDEPLKRAPSHRLLAVLRGQAEGLLTVKARPAEDRALPRIRSRWLRGEKPARDAIESALVDAYRRLLLPSLEREVLKQAKANADRDAIEVFAKNLRELLMTAPLGDKSILAVDPGFRSGGKLVALGPRGDVLEHDIMFLHREREAAEKIRRICAKHRIEAIAVGNGTAGRETETFLRGLSLDDDLDPNPMIVMVNESGASIYSASAIAREEFPDFDLTVRGAISIGRRLQDPLAELVKVDPKSIGVGQYQHDVDNAALQTSLDDVVIGCVNSVGVDLNTASAPLLSYVSGLTPVLARNIVERRQSKGPFGSREDLLKVSRLGPRAFEQAAGFLRIRDGKQPLDASAVHPERYPLVQRIASDLGSSIRELVGRSITIDLDPYVGGGVGHETLRDIVAELAKPGRDPRPSFEAFEFAEVHEIRDLTPGMRLPGIVTNVTNFGAFVDVGVHQDGLVHISQLANDFVANPHDVVKVQDRVHVVVLEVDLERSRIGLSMKKGID